jgi:hypothetical protein|uniref:Uncharacterized protein n=1 Tax=viral metagenome TaxID=1070528 RepID=A0A6C0CL25_9ZZZZ
MKNNLLNNVENYNDQIDQNECILFLKYIGLIHELIEIATDNIYIQKEVYLKYILITAIKNVSYIYNFLLLYTKNLDLTIYHTQKSILYYIEFITQISDDNHSFLKLSSKDATLFSYKKTIFDVNQEYRKEYIESDETKQKIKRLNHFVNIYNLILIKYIEHLEFNDNLLPNLQKTVFTKFYNIVESLIQFKLNSNDFDNKLTDLYKIIEILNKNYQKPFLLNNYLNIIIFMSKKILKKNISVTNINNKLIIDDEIDKLKNYSICKIVNYLIN